MRSSAAAATLLLLVASPPPAHRLPAESVQAQVATVATLDSRRTSAETLKQLVGQQWKLHAAPADRSAECLAKVVYHEAANQPLSGQLAVAQLVINRVRHEAFPKNICAVVNQPGQFFQADSYKPPADPRWRTAVAVASLARQEHVQPVVPGALFFHAAYAHPDWRHHVRLARIGDQVFYR